MMTGLSSLENHPYPPPKKSQSIMVKCLIIMGIVLISLVPLLMIGGIIQEREYRKQAVVNEISENWGGKQTIVGPILTIPYLEGNKRKICAVFPDGLKSSFNLKKDIRHRNIFQAIVYKGTTHIEGDFNLSALIAKIPAQSLQWKESHVEFALTDPANLEKQAFLDWQGQKIPIENTAKNILSTSVPTNPKLSKLPFKLDLSLRGTESLMVGVIGKQNTIQIDSDWTSPSFTGRPLPSNKDFTEDGFSANWTMGPQGIHPRAGFLSYPSEVNNPLQAIFVESIGSQIGVELLQPVDGYRQTERAIKYSFLFVLLTFATYFLFELIAKQPLHPFQYLLIAFAICLFYLLLLAFSEFIQFGFAYLVASCGIIATISLYSKAILGKVYKHAPILIGGLLSVLYGYLYILLQLEDLSLLFGSLGLFAILGAIMYVTRNIDWYGETGSIQAH